jgi:hypothetical protein
MPANDTVIPPFDTEDAVYRDRLARAVYGMFTAEGNAAVHAVVQEVRALMADGLLVTRDEVRLALRARMTSIEEQEATAEAGDSEVWIHLTYTFEDIIPDDQRWPRGWLQSDEVHVQAMRVRRETINAD